MSIVVSMSMFFLSFIPLWISILFIDIKSIICGGAVWTEIITLIVLCIHMVMSCAIVWNSLRPKSRSRHKSYRLVSASEEKVISAEYLLSYILPLVAFDFTRWDQVVLFLIFYLTLAFLCIRHNHLSINVLLEICRYRFYECEIENEDGICVDKRVITKQRMELLVGTQINLSAVNNEYSVHLNMDE